MWRYDLHPRDQYGRFRLKGTYGMHVPHADDRTYRDARGRVFDTRTGFLVNSRAAREGWFRVGDLPEGAARHAPGGEARPGDASARGAWHKPGEYGPGKVPILRTEQGTPLSSLQPEDPRTFKHKRARGAFARGELKAEHRLYVPGEGGFKEVRRRGRPLKTVSAEVHGAYQNDPRNPVGRQRTMPGHRRRQQRTTWIQRVNDQIEGR